MHKVCNARKVSSNIIIEQYSANRKNLIYTLIEPIEKILWTNSNLFIKTSHMVFKYWQFPRMKFYPELTNKLQIEQSSRILRVKKRHHLIDWFEIYSFWVLRFWKSKKVDPKCIFWVILSKNLLAHQVVSRTMLTDVLGIGKLSNGKLAQRVWLVVLRKTQLVYQGWTYENGGIAKFR